MLETLAIQYCPVAMRYLMNISVRLVNNATLYCSRTLRRIKYDVTLIAIRRYVNCNKTLR